MTSPNRALLCRVVCSAFVLSALVAATASARSPDLLQPAAWTEQKVTASNGVAHDAFGQSIAIRGTTALIGAVDVNDWEGAIYVFTQADGVWTEGPAFMADDGVPGDRATFGTAIMNDGDTAVIGALGATVNGHANQGAAYVFRETGGVW